MLATLGRVAGRICIHSGIRNRHYDVPAKNLAGEEHSHGKHEQKDPDHPRQLTRILAGPVQKNLRHVGQEQNDHAGPGVVVKRAQEPAERLLVVEEEKALVRLVGGGHIDQRRADTGDDLNQNESQRGAPEDVPPAHRSSGRLRNGMSQHRPQALAQAEAGLEPCTNRAQPVVHCYSSNKRFHRQPVRSDRLGNEQVVVRNLSSGAVSTRTGMGQERLIGPAQMEHPIVAGMLRRNKLAAAGGCNEWRLRKVISRLGVQPLDGEPSGHKFD